VPTFADRGCHAIPVTDPYDRIIGFLDRTEHTVYIYLHSTCNEDVSVYSYALVRVKYRNVGMELKLRIVIWSKMYNLVFILSHGSAVGIAGYGLDDRGAGVRVPVGLRIPNSPHRPSRLCFATQTPIQWVPFTHVQSGRCGTLTTHLQLVPRSRKCGYIPPLPHAP
jgi:hypothetical protein